VRNRKATDPALYELSDSKGEEIDSVFYTQELQLV
jgi:hypothetical protein